LPPFFLLKEVIFTLSKKFIVPLLPTKKSQNSLISEFWNPDIKKEDASILSSKSVYLPSANTRSCSTAA